jgi:hypothetical protein
MKETITASIDADGNVTFVAKGYKGKHCITEILSVIKSLGKITKQEKTSEYFKNSEASHQIKN